jgi:hypothetical protein
MVLNMPAFLILFGEEAAALQGDIAASLLEYLDGAQARSVTLWRVDAAAQADDAAAFACHGFRWADMAAEGYIETAFSVGYERMTDVQPDAAGYAANCYVGVVVCGTQADPQALGALESRLKNVLSCLNVSLRSHLIWLIEDRVTHLGGNYRMLAHDLEGGEPALGRYGRITVLSGNQMNGGNSYATRRQRLDALAPCVLETANALMLDGAPVQTVAYRKLNCTGGEIRRLMGQRVIDALWTWLEAPMDTTARWALFTTPDMPFADYADLDASRMAQSLIRHVEALLPPAEAMLVVADPYKLYDPVAPIADFECNNDEALLARFGGDAWESRWFASVEDRLRHCLTLRTAAAFVAPGQPMRQRLAAMADEAAVLARGQDYRLTPAPSGGWLHRRRDAYTAYETAAGAYRYTLACRILIARLKRMLKALDRVAALCDAMLDAVQEALRAHRMPRELEALYHAMAEKYDEAIVEALGTLHLRDDGIMGDTLAFYPTDGEALATLWRGVHRRLMARVMDANDIFRQGFSEAYALHKDPQTLEKETRNSLAACSWQLSGGTVAETGLAAYFANRSICDVFPNGQLAGEPLRCIPGDLVAYMRLGTVAATLADLLTFMPFRKGEAFPVNDDAILAMQAKQSAPAAEPPPAPPEPAAEENPWHMRLDRRADDYILYWEWPNGHTNDAVIQITHAGGVRTALNCPRELYNVRMGCIIAPGKLGLGTNTVAVVHDQQMQAIQAMGRRVTVHYKAQPLRRRKCVALGGGRVQLNCQAIVYQIDDPSMETLLRVQHYSGMSPLLSSLPVLTRLTDGGTQARFYSAAALVRLCAAPEGEQLLDFQEDLA